MSESFMSRRQFLKQSAGVGAAFAFPAIVPAHVLGAAAPSNRVTVGHIGVGTRGTQDLEAFLGLPECWSIAVSDCFESRRAAAARRIDGAYNATGCKMYADFRELCADPGIDAVVVATPDHWHVLAALEAVRAGKPVYVEKPLGLSIEQDHAIRAAVETYGVVFQYGTQQRSQDHMRWTCEMVVNGRLGKLLAVEVNSPGGSQGGSTAPVPVPADLDYNRFLGPAPMAPYTADRCTNSGSYFISDFALGFIAGWGAHPLDIMVWGLGDTPAAVPVEYSGAGVFPTEGLFDTAMRWNVTGAFADGKSFVFRGGPMEDRTTFIGEKGRIGVARGGIREMEPASLRNEKLGPGDKRLIRSTNHGGNFIDCVKSGARTVSPVDVACLSDTVSQLSDIAIRTGRTVRWDPFKEVILNDPSATRAIHRPIREPWTLG